MLYCAICQYPAPCGRDHGEDEDGNDIHPVTPVQEPDIWIDGTPLSWTNAPTEWKCPHCNEQLLLAEADVHIEKHHDDCMFCSADRLLIAGILDWEARHPDLHLVQ